MPRAADRRALLVIAKRPLPGQTKTRLSPPLDADQAARLYEAFLRDTLDLARAVPDVARFVLYLPEAATAYFRALAPDLPRERAMAHHEGRSPSWAQKRSAAD